MLRKISLLIACVLGGLIANPQEVRRIYTRLTTDADVLNGAERIDQYLPMIKGKSVGIVANYTAMLGETHLVDTLLSLGVKIKKVYCPEHGFRGEGDAGENIKNSIDKKTKIPVVSLYGKKKKPSPEDLKGIDVVLFDIQDVGLRFYTYISTMTYVMEACAEQGIPMIVLDRPNPNGYFVDGPILEPKYKSFIGMHPVPMVHGMTIAEYAQMVNGEGWLANGVKVALTCIPVENYKHSDMYQLPIKPSPNLPNMAAVYLYTSLGFFEGTCISVGRGTDKPFQIIGHPQIADTSFSFIPESRPGAKDPPFKGQNCYGYDLSTFSVMFLKNMRKIYLFWVLEFYKNFEDKENFFNTNFNYLSGNSSLKKMIIDGKSEEEIRKTWIDGLNQFMNVRAKYLLYPDFE